MENLSSKIIVGAVVLCILLTRVNSFALEIVANIDANQTLAVASIGDQFQLGNISKTSYGFTIMMSLILISTAFVLTFMSKKIRYEKERVFIKKTEYKKLEQQLELEKVEKDNLEEKLRYKEKDIEILVNHSKIDKQTGSYFLSELEKIIKTESSNLKMDLMKLRRNVIQQIQLQEQFYVKAENLVSADAEFETKLTNEFPSLTTMERELCIYMKAGMSNKEIAIHKNVKVDSIKTMQYRIRKKFGFARTEELYRFLKSL